MLLKKTFEFKVTVNLVHLFRVTLWNFEFLAILASHRKTQKRRIRKIKIVENVTSNFSNTVIQLIRLLVFNKTSTF